MILHVGHQFFCRRRLTGLENDAGFTNFAPFFIRDADHGTHVDGGMLVKHVLDLNRVDILSAGDEHILFAVTHEKVPFLIVFDDIARMKPTVFIENFGRSLGIIPISGAPRRSLEQHLAGLIGTERIVIFVDHAHVNEEVRATNTARLADRIFRRERKKTGTILRHPKALFESDALFLGIKLDQWDGKRRTA